MTRSALTELEQAAFGGFLVTHGRLRRAFESRLAAAGGLGLGEYDVLSALDRSPGGASRMSELADRVVMTSGGFTRLVDRLVRAGLVRRERCPDDGRGSFAVLTDAGRELLEVARPRREEQVRRLFLDHMDDEDMRRMAAVWQRILASEALAGDGGGAHPLDGGAPDRPDERGAGQPSS